MSTDSNWCVCRVAGGESWNLDPDKEGAHTVKYKVLTQDEWTDLNYRDRVDRLRSYVEEKSGNKIGYLHISAMGYNNQA